MVQRIFLHIGAPKSGTTFLQSLLWRNRSRLLSSDVLIPGTKLFQHNRAAMAVQRGLPSFGGSAGHTQVWHELVDAARGFDGATVISNEWFVKVTDEQADKALATLAGLEVHIMFTARDFVTQIPAAWQETLKLGSGLSIGQFVDRMDDDSQQWSWPSFDGALALPRWADALPPEHVHVVTLPPSGARPWVLWNRFCRVVGADPSGSRLRRSRTNESLGAEPARLLQLAGPLLREATEADTSHWTEQYRWLRRYLGHQLLVPRGGSPIGLPPELISRLREHTATSRAALEAAGYDVVGHLEDLEVAGERPGTVVPDDVGPQQMLDVAVPVITDLLGEVRSQTRRAHVAEGLQTRGVPPPASVAHGRASELASVASRLRSAPDGPVVVDLAEARAGTVPDDVGPQQMLDVAVPLIADLLGEVRRQTLRADVAEGLQTPGVPLPATVAKRRPTRLASATSRLRSVPGGTHVVDVLSAVAYRSRDAVRARRGPRRSRTVGTRPEVVGNARLYFLIINVDGTSGIQRAVLTLVNSLADAHDIEVISVHRWRDQAAYEIDPRVRVTHLADVRTWSSRLRPSTRRAAAELRDQPSRFAPEDSQINARTDRWLADKISALEPGILISTRPSLHVAAAELAPPGMVVVAQDHLNFEARMGDPMWATAMERAGRQLHGLAVLTQADAADYALFLRGSNVQIEAMGNALPWPVTDSSDTTAKVVIAAGQLIQRKGFGRLIRAYTPIAREHPDWQLHIYGDGPARDALQSRIDEAGVGDQVVLKGHSAQLERELAAASIYVMSSSAEGFPMVLIEAMSKGLPLISFDCPRGPSDIIEDGRNGRLLRNGDIPGMTAAIRELIEDPDLRRRMGAASLEDAHHYEPSGVSAHWESWLAQVTKEADG
ncbi:MAG: glycosyltransferase family 4 protein [Nocardioidaceae bacterium]